MLVGPGHLVEQRGFSAVLIAHQTKGQNRVIRQRVLTFLLVIPAVLAEARMFAGNNPLHSAMLVFAFLYGGNVDLLRLGQAQRQFISVNLKFHRVPHRRILHHGHFRAGDDSHVKKVLSECTFPADLCDYCALPNAQILQYHKKSSVCFVNLAFAANPLPGACPLCFGAYPYLSAESFVRTELL